MKSKSWKMERASVTVKGKERPHSNKYSHADGGAKPDVGAPTQTAWVGHLGGSMGVLPDMRRIRRSATIVPARKRITAMGSQFHE